MKNKILYMLGLVFLLAGCKDKKNEEKVVVLESSRNDAIVISNQIRDNLGIDFIKVEKRKIESTFRIPGRFELSLDAMQDYAPLLGGKLTLAVSQYQIVNKGDLLFTISSIEWLNFKQQLQNAKFEISQKKSELNVLQSLKLEQVNRLALLNERLTKLNNLEMVNIDLNLEIKNVRSKIDTQKVEITAANNAIKLAKNRYNQLLNQASAYVAEDLNDNNWSAINDIKFYAKNSGVIELKNTAINGAVVADGDVVLRITDTTKVQFRAETLQSDLLRLKNNQSVRIVPPLGTKIAANSYIEGTLLKGVQNDFTSLTFPLLVKLENSTDWALPGINAFVEIIENSSVNSVLAIPTKCILQDGLNYVFFRKNPKNSNEIIRVEADLGISDGRWTEVKSAVRFGDEIVYNGSYELKLATEGGEGNSKDKPKGHFHADGNWHVGEH